MHPLDKYQQQLMKIIDARPVNLINEVRPLTIQFFTKIKTPPLLLRQRAFLMILMVNELQISPAYRSYVHALIEEIFFCVSAFLERQDEEYMTTLATVEFTSCELVDDTIPIILKLRPAKSLSAIKALYKLTDENADAAFMFKLNLKKMIFDYPDLVVEWIRCLKYDEFKQRYLDELIVSIMAGHMDLKALLITDRDYARKVVQFLDKALDRRTYRGQLFDDLRGMFTDVEITKKIAKITKEFNIDALTFCPVSVRKRRLADFMYNINQRGKEERAQLSRQCMEEFNDSDNFDVIKALAALERKDQYAGVACGRIYGLSDQELCKILPGYKDAVNWNEEKIVAKMNEFNDNLIAEEYISELKIDDNYMVYLIDDVEKLKFATQKLSENDKVAFDVEANYVCQSITGTQQASLLQIALKDSVLLIDIFTLLQKVPDEEIKTFFEMFLGSDTDRVVFDVRSDLNLLRQTFDWMPEYIEERQPAFYCVQRFAKLIETNETYKVLFDEVANPSLAELASKWLGVDLSKAQRQGNWLKRPLSKDQMIYAATDARYTLDLYYYIEQKLMKQNLDNPMSVLCVTPGMIDRKKTKNKKGGKESLDEILPVVAEKIKEMRETLHTFENPENITIVVDFAFLPIAAFLRQFGYKTFDQRDAEGGEHFTREEVIKTLSNFIKDRIADGTIARCFLLTDEHSSIRFITEIDNDELKVINCGLDETESSVICNIIYETNTIFEIEDVQNRCTKCGDSKYAVDFPADVFRVVYIHFAKHKQFFFKLKCDDNSLELLENLESRKIIEIRDQSMIYRINDTCAVTFILSDEIMGQLNYEAADGKLVETKKKYKCNTRVFETIGDKPNVRFCLGCFEFF